MQRKQEICAMVDIEFFKYPESSVAFLIKRDLLIIYFPLDVINYYIKILLNVYLFRKGLNFLTTLQKAYKRLQKNI